MAGIGDGVSEGLGWIRREIHKVHLPPLLPWSDSSMPGPVPLEFDEEDEDFQVCDIPTDDGGLQVPPTTTTTTMTRHLDEPSSTSRGTSHEAGTSTKSLSLIPLLTRVYNNLIIWRWWMMNTM
jgi:hypothetical protein